ncbi:MAG: glutaredoxin family protein [Tenacibaculum sp.]
MKIKLYGAQRCHKTQYYQSYFKTRNLDYAFFDVEENEDYANDLRALYENRKLNFPTITIQDKKLRNPNNKELNKWLAKANLQSL